MRDNAKLVERHKGPKDQSYMLYKSTVNHFYFWSMQGNNINMPRELDGTFTDHSKAVKSLERYLKRGTDPYISKQKKRYGGNPWDDTWKMPPPEPLAKEEVNA